MPDHQYISLAEEKCHVLCSPVKSFAYNIGSTGVEEIVGAGEGPVRYFDLNGREVKGEKLERGVYVRMQGGNATKVLVK